MKFDDETKSEQYKDFNTHANVRRLFPENIYICDICKVGWRQFGIKFWWGNVHKQRRGGNYF